MFNLTYTITDLFLVRELIKLSVTEVTQMHSVVFDLAVFLSSVEFHIIFLLNVLVFQHSFNVLVHLVFLQDCQTAV